MLIDDLTVPPSDGSVSAIPVSTLEQVEQAIRELLKGRQGWDKLRFERERQNALTLSEQRSWPASWKKLLKAAFSTYKTVKPSRTKDLQKKQVGPPGIPPIGGGGPTISAPDFESQMRTGLNQMMFQPDPMMLDITLSTVASHDLREMPVFSCLTGPPACGKTEHLILVTKIPAAEVLDDLTEHTLLSGYDPDAGKDSDGPKRKMGFLDRHPDPIVLMPDGNTILKKDQHKREAIFGQLLRIYDGTFKRETGMGEPLPWKGHFTLLMGVTPEIYSYFNIISSIGPRFIFYNIKTSPREGSSKTAFEPVANKKDIQDRLTDLVALYFSQLPISHADFTEPDKEWYPVLGDVISEARSTIKWSRGGEDSTREVTEVVKEGPGRLVKEIKAMVKGHARWLQQEMAGPRQRSLALEMGFSSLTPAKRLLLLSLFYHPGLFLDQLAKTGLATEYMLDAKAEELMILDMVDGKGSSSRGFQYALKPHIQKKLGIILTDYPDMDPLAPFQ